MTWEYVKVLFEGSDGKDSIPTTEYNYVNAEKSLKDAAKEYYADTFKESEVGEISFMTISYSLLKDKNYIESLNANNENCDGYVTVRNQKNGIIYDPYIKCENYITEGYSASLNN